MKPLTMFVVTALMSLLSVFPAEAHVFAVHFGRQATTALSDYATLECEKVQSKLAIIYIYPPYGPETTIAACWQEVSAALQKKLGLKPNGIEICPLPNNFVGMDCSYILKEEFIDPASVPPPPRPAFK